MIKSPGRDREAVLKVYSGLTKKEIVGLGLVEGFPQLGGLYLHPSLGEQLWPALWDVWVPASIF